MSSGRSPIRAGASCSTASMPATARPCGSCVRVWTWRASRSASTWRSWRRRISSRAFVAAGRSSTTSTRPPSTRCASADPEQVVLESEPPRRLSYTWQTLTDELAESLEMTDEARTRVAAEKRSKVTFDIEPLGDVVKLTVVHDGFEAGSLMASMVSQGWPSVLSNLKTLLETGETLPESLEPVPPVRLGLTKERSPK